MSITIGEVLENADYNINSKHQVAHSLGRNQLKNAIYLLNEKGKTVDDVFDEADLD